MPPFYSTTTAHGRGDVWEVPHVVGPESLLFSVCGFSGSVLGVAMDALQLSHYWTERKIWMVGSRPKAKEKECTSAEWPVVFIYLSTQVLKQNERRECM